MDKKGLAILCLIEGSLILMLYLIGSAMTPRDRAGWGYWPVDSLLFVLSRYGLVFCALPLISAAVGGYWLAGGREGMAWLSLALLALLAAVAIVVLVILNRSHVYYGGLGG